MEQSQILFYVHQQPMEADHGTQYERNPSGHHRGMLKDGMTVRRTDLTNGRMDRQTDGLDPSLYSPIPLRRSRE